MTLFEKIFKRIMDIFCSFAFIIIFFPLFIAVGILIKLESEGSIFFIQERVGRNGVLFKCIKFRTMFEHKIISENDYEIKKDDPKITPFGLFLRRWAIDEMPQLFNVLIGDMSIVGPRPTLLYQVEKYDDFQKKRLLVKPGLTGWAQVNGRNKLTWPERIKLDVFYVEHCSIVFDIKILFLTFKVLITGEGVYSNR
jgi:lipopolysaccharide/colanic/teichoic acid biosynthesis glycosyltransferase